jgi:enamine deaminase RidA (YjgF/YER057c/UK114 family)
LIIIGGWNPETGEMDNDINDQTDQAFKNVQLNLTDAGGKGWDQVYRIVSYHAPLNDEALGAMVRNLKQWCPNHEPIWTVLGVAMLGQENMKVEIDAFAHIPK